MNTDSEIKPDGLRGGEFGWLVFGSLLLTPLFGAALAVHWQQERPKAGRQALWTSLVLGSFLGVVWVIWVFRG